MNILDSILEYKRLFVSETKRVVPLDGIREAASIAPKTRGFARSLRGTRNASGERESQCTMRVIAEIKRASPSKGILRENFDPAEIAHSYERGGASALSVLTDEKFFQGSLDALRAARKSAALPILRKEFMIDPYQVYEARAAGADAILLIAGLIPWSELSELRELARTLTLDVLLEIHREDELAEALKLSPDALGMNNRDLRSADFNTDISRTEAILPLVPPSQTFVSESGIGNAADVERLKRMGVDAILVGEHLMREADPGAAIESKFGIVNRKS